MPPSATREPRLHVLLAREHAPLSMARRAQEPMPCLAGEHRLRVGSVSETERYTPARARRRIAKSDNIPIAPRAIVKVAGSGTGVNTPLLAMDQPSAPSLELVSALPDVTN